MMCVLLLTASAALAQEGDSYQAERQRAFRLMEESKFTEALPILEKLAKENPNDGPVIYALGFSIFAGSQNIKDPQARKQARSRARSMLIRAKELGSGDNLSEQLINAIPPDGGEESTFSRNKEADAAMREAEAAFTRGELEKALALYERALQLDPQLYEAALFAGDMYFKMGFNERDAARKSGLMDKAGVWFAKAITINPDAETAYRYWGDALLEQGKMTEARDKFIEAIIAEPYKQRSYVGLEKWAQRNNVSLGHPSIKMPNAMRTEGNQTTITIDPKTLQSDDGSKHWTLYSLTRAAWPAGRFAKEFPAEKAYRHTLREETEALRMVADAVAKDFKGGKIKQLEPSLARLVKLHEAGLLEPYVLFARADAGIARDYPAYRQASRDKLRRYWNEIVIGGDK
jgi:tetratricopeptide (TPR) repeat protein